MAGDINSMYYYLSGKDQQNNSVTTIMYGAPFVTPTKFWTVLYNSRYIHLKHLEAWYTGI